MSRELRKKLEKLKRNFDKEIISALHKAVLKVESEVVRQFETQGEGRWKELNPKYLKRKVKEGYSDKILIRTGALFHSITSAVDEREKVGVVGVKRPVKGKGKIWELGMIHEYGTRDGRIPPRPFMHPALQNSEEYLKKLFGEAIKLSIKKI